MLSQTGKIYHRILERRLRDCVDDRLDDCQFGFRPGRSTTEAVFTVKMMLEKCWEWGVDKYALFVDIQRPTTESAEVCYGDFCKKTTIMW